MRDFLLVRGTCERSPPSSCRLLEQHVPAGRLRQSILDAVLRAFYGGRLPFQQAMHRIGGVWFPFGRVSFCCASAAANRAGGLFHGSKPASVDQHCLEGGYATSRNDLEMMPAIQALVKEVQALPACAGFPWHEVEDLLCVQVNAYRATPGRAPEGIRAHHDGASVDSRYPIIHVHVLGGGRAVLEVDGRRVSFDFEAGSLSVLLPGADAIAKHARENPNLQAGDVALTLVMRVLHEVRGRRVAHKARSRLEGIPLDAAAMTTLREFVPAARLAELLAAEEGGGLLGGGMLRQGDIPALLGRAFSPDRPMDSRVLTYRRVKGPRVLIDWCITAVLLANALWGVRLIGRRARADVFRPGDTFLKSQAMYLCGIEPGGFGGSVRGTKKEGACYLWLSPCFTSLLSDDGETLVFSFVAERRDETGTLKSTGNSTILKATAEGSIVRCGGRLPAAQMARSGLCREEDEHHLGKFGYLFVGNATLALVNADERLWHLTMRVEDADGYQRQALGPFLEWLAMGAAEAEEEEAKEEVEDSAAEEERAGGKAAEAKAGAQRAVEASSAESVEVAPIVPMPHERQAAEAEADAQRVEASSAESFQVAPIVPMPRERREDRSACLLRAARWPTHQFLGILVDVPIFHTTGAVTLLTVPVRAPAYLCTLPTALVAVVWDFAANDVIFCQIYGHEFGLSGAGANYLQLPFNAPLGLQTETQLRFQPQTDLRFGGERTSVRQLLPWSVI